MESELFGYVKGALPQAHKDKKGKLLLADEGTLFLDEVSDLSLKIQTKLNRAVEEQMFEPLGTSEPITFNTRLIAATSKNLREVIARGKFREDLYFKLNIIPLAVPPLRERTEDIPLLIEHFLKHFSGEYGKKPKTMSAEAMVAFLKYVWPGNVSELMNVIERFVIMVQEDEIASSHLSLLVETRELEHVSHFFEGHSLEKAEEQFQRRYIHRVLMRNNWEIPKAAFDLKIDEASLREKIKALNITFVA
jgi:two-component system nitrogen regulation response regulator NtrX